MKVKIIGTRGSNCPLSFLLDDSLLIDTGSACCALSVSEIRKIKSILISHSHLDHVYGLPFILENHAAFNDKLEVFALPETMDALKDNFFNDVIWPDVFRFLSPNQLRFVPLRISEQYRVGNFSVIPFKLEHIIACIGFSVSDGERTLVYATDTGSIETVKDFLKKSSLEVDALFIECSFPDEHHVIARESGHLIPSDIAELERFISSGTQLYVHHIKSAYMEKVVSQLESVLKRPFFIAGDEENIVI